MNCSLETVNSKYYDIKENNDNEQEDIQGGGVPISLTK